MDVPDNKHLGDDCDSLSSTFQLSINEIAARHPRERLLVHPLRWTDRQVTLLDCRIHSRCVSEPEGARSTAAHENANPDAASSNPDDDLVRLLARRLNYQISWENWIDTARRLLRPLGRRISVDDWEGVRLYFNRRPHASTSFRYCRMSVSIRRPAPKTLTFICFNHDETELERRLLFRPVENHRHMDIPGLYRLHTLLKLHKPTDPEKDPFLVALVIALAQKKRRHAPQPEPPSSSFAVRLLFTGKGRPKSVNLYVARVRACFLDKLDFPGKQPSVDSSLDIYHWHIPPEPFQNLPHRLCRVLMRNYCGEMRDFGGRGDSGKGAKKKRKRDLDGDSCTTNAQEIVAI